MKKNVRKYLLKMALALLIAGAIGLVYVRLTVEARRMLNVALPHTVERATDGLYSLAWEDATIHPVRGFVSLHAVSLRPNADRLEELRRENRLPPFYGSLTVRQLRLEGLNFLKLKSKELHFQKVFIAGPCLELTREWGGFSVRQQGDTAQSSTPPPHAKRPSYLTTFSASHIRLEGGEGTLCLKNEADTTLVEVQKLHLEALNFRLDSLSGPRKPLWHSDQFRLSIDSTHTFLPHRLYAIQTGPIRINLQDSSFQINRIACSSPISKWKFAYADPKHSDWLDLQIGRLEGRNFRFQQWIQTQSLLMDSLTVANVRLENYKNRRIPTPTRIVPVIYRQVQKFPIPFRVQGVRISDLNVLYEEWAVGKPRPGALRATHINAVFDGFTNIVSSHTQTNALTMSGKLMNAGLVRARILFPVDSTYDVVDIRGSLGPMEMGALNSLVEPMAPLRIRSGRIRGMDFHIWGGMKKSNIDMCLLYNDLSIQVLLEGRGKKPEDAALSFLTNALMKRDNPTSGEKPRRVQAEHIRSPYHSSFNNLWKLYLAGLEQTMNMPKYSKKLIPD